jgi:hypothetical protein
MELTNDNEQPGMPSERRSTARSTRLRNHRIEIKLVGEPVYQFKVRDVSPKGAGILVKDDSAFLTMVEVGRILEVHFISPRGSEPTGYFKAEIKHISQLKQSRYKGHRVIGISILEKIEDPS